MCCAACKGFSLGGRVHTVTDPAGRAWTFEDHPRLGPIILRKDGNPMARQPGDHSTFWAALQGWSDRRGRHNPLLNE
jgi:uncharacterized protein RhaS with RHS repeats